MNEYIFLEQTHIHTYMEDRTAQDVVRRFPQTMRTIKKEFTELHIDDHELMHIEPNGTFVFYVHVQDQPEEFTKDLLIEHREIQLYNMANNKNYNNIYIFLLTGGTLKYEPKK